MAELLGRRPSARRSTGSTTPSPAGAGCSSCAASRASARAPCSATCPSASPAGAWRRAVGVESEIELAYSGLHQLCAPMLDHLDGCRPRSAMRSRPCSGAALAHRPTDSWWARHADAVRRGRRATAARLHRRRRAVARRRLGADPRVRRPPAAGRTDRDRLRRPHGHRRSRPRRPARAGDHGTPRPRSRALLLTTCAGRWMRRSSTRSSRRATATRSRSSSCRAPGRRRTRRRLRSARAPVAGKIEQSYAQRLALLPPRPGCSCLPRPPSPLGDLVLLHRAAAARAST